jgi:hypothetical protein
MRECGMQTANKRIGILITVEDSDDSVRQLLQH